VSDHEQALEPMLRLTITPEPTDEEAAAVAAAVSLLSLTFEQEPPVPGSDGRLSSWVVTGRLAAHHAAPRARQRRWSRTLAWLERNR
jgi:hypothetical protein